jgi:hypothetical protein
MFDNGALSGRAKLLPRLNFLVSYAFLRVGRRNENQTRFEELMLALAPYADVLIDSGAFTDFTKTRNALAAGTQYTPISVDEYIDACKLYRGKVWQYIMLDVIENAVASKQNLDRMVAAGLRPMPVFVYPESPDIVPELVAINPYICVPGGVEGRLQFVRQRYQFAYAKSDGRARIHGLGFVRHPDMFRLPLASVDSSSWTTGARFGVVSYYTPRGGTTRSLWHEITQEREPSLWRHLQRCGIAPSDLSDPSNHKSNYGIPSLLSVFASVQQHQHCYRYGLRYFFSVARSLWIRQLLCVVSTVDHQTNAFDYHAARRLSLKMQDVEKNDFALFVKWCVNVLSTCTDWQTEIRLKQEFTDV